MTALAYSLPYLDLAQKVNMASANAAVNENAVAVGLEDLKNGKKQDRPILKTVNKG